MTDALEWPFAAEWYAPDLDRGYIVHKRLRGGAVARISDRAASQIYDAAERYAAACDAAGIAVTADSWLLCGTEALG